MGIYDVQGSTEMATTTYWHISTASDYPTATIGN